MAWANHLVIAPILLPLVTGAFLLLFDERRRALKAMVSLFATLTLLVIATILVTQAATAANTVYLLGNWKFRRLASDQPLPPVRQR